MGSGSFKPLDDESHQPQGTEQNEEKGNGHRLAAVAIIITKRPDEWSARQAMREGGAGEGLSGAAASAHLAEEEAGEDEAVLFVYGTLKRGQPNHGRLQGARWLGAAWLEGACLYDLGPFPMAIAAEGRVCGELYAVARAVLPLLDAFEGCPRLYQRHWLPLGDGRQAWVYLGQARQVRHSRRLPRGAWPPVDEAGGARSLPVVSRRLVWLRGMVWALPLLCALLAAGGRAAGFDTLGACQSWRHSHGLARLELANAIGAAHFLTKRHPFAESTADHPLALYDPADIARVCGRP
jgi:gamma-glutamylcyclotransferase (GGCT)/AIG2-like uncharacterized protein YtfP